MQGRLKKDRLNYVFSGVFLVATLLQSLMGLAPHLRLDQYLADQWTTPSEIPSDKIFSIAQSVDGYLWLATKKGLLRFNGHSFELIHFETGKQGKPDHSNLILADTLFVDRAGKLWIGSKGALTSYDHRTRQFHTYHMGPGVATDNIRHISQDSRNNLWISFVQGNVVRFAKGNFKSFTKNGPGGLSGKRVNSIVSDKRGELLFVTRNEGIFFYDGGNFSQSNSFDLKAIKAAVVTMIETRDGSFWLGTEAGLVKISNEQLRVYTTADGLSHNHISTILEDSEGTIWIGTTRGLNRMIKKNGESAFEQLWQPETIWTLFEDREGSLWVGTYGTGLKRLKNRRFMTFPPLKKYAVGSPFSLYRTSRGDILVGTSGGHVLKFRNHRHIQTLKPGPMKDSIITALDCSADGKLWAGTNNKGLFREKKNQWLHASNPDNGRDEQITCLLIDTREIIWAGTYNGTKILPPSGNTPHYLYPGNGLQGKRVHFIYEDSKHNIWIATDKGITFLQDGNRDIQNLRYYLPEVPVTSIHESSATGSATSGFYWISTNGMGLKRLSIKTGIIDSFGKKNGMGSSQLTRVFEDNRGNLLLTGDTGILLVNRSEINKTGRKNIGWLNCINLDISDGLKSSGFTTPFSQHRVIKTPKDEIWVINNKEVFILPLNDMIINEMPPPVIIETVTFNHHRVMPANADNLGTYRGVTKIYVEFSANSLLSTRKATIKYKLEGIDKKWHYLTQGKQRKVEYTNPGLGAFKFRLMASNADGVWNSQDLTVGFSLAPYFYQTISFKIGLAFVLLITVFSLYKFYRRASVLEQKAADKAKYKESSNGLSLPKEYVQQCINNLLHLMEVEKVYRDETLNLPALAEKTNTPRHHLSEILNKHLKRSFSDFINYYRIEEVKECLQDTANTDKIQAIAYEAGFNTEASFYSAFKKFTGITPGQFRKKAANKKL